jgi:hypothetical protein
MQASREETHVLDWSDARPPNHTLRRGFQWLVFGHNCHTMTIESHQTKSSMMIFH